MNKNLILNGLNESIAYCEAMGLSNCFKAYANECNGEYIESIGFNPNSGYVYISLGNGVSICSFMGERCEFLITDFETGEETFFDNYTLAINNNQ